MPTLSIHDDNGKETVKVTIRNLDPSEATIAVLSALKPLKEVPPPRKTRSDAGKPKRKPAETITTP